MQEDNKRGHLHEDKTSPYSEHKIESLDELYVLMQAIDLDEGIRIGGQVEGFENGGFIFVAKPGGRYCINICDRIYDPEKRVYTVGGRDRWFYFETFDEAWETLKKLIRNPIEAYSY